MILDIEASMLAQPEKKKKNEFAIIKLEIMTGLLLCVFT